MFSGRVEEAGPSTGSGLPLDAPVLTATGWKAMKDVAVGDLLVDPRGGQSQVLRLHPGGVQDIHRVTLQDGSQAYASSSHQWEFQARDSNNRKKLEVGSTTDLKAFSERKHWQVLLPKPEPYQFEDTGALPLDPYFVGILLAEGSLSDQVLTFSSEDPEIIQRISSTLPDGMRLSKSSSERVKYRIIRDPASRGSLSYSAHRNPVLLELERLGLRGTRSHDKFVPDVYLRAEAGARLEVLRGFMDGDGSCKADGNARLTSSSLRLIEGIRELIWSLGGRAKITVKRNHTYRNPTHGVRAARDVYWIPGICGMTLNPFWLNRKASNFKHSPKSDSYSRKVKRIEHVGRAPVQGVEMASSSQLIITGDAVVTRHTRMATVPQPRTSHPVAEQTALF
ncbi:LAGLIDADG family homing endonuclease [Streptomyces sp. NPDC048723]|uniref:LAGLIDADG family homing endonuclease n=1 Tax=Streptomyces sp. NPDC048723 TaxID=3365589 RepID=UPI00371D5BB0